MTEKVARIVWLSELQGGRTSVPSGSRYIAPARFDSEKIPGANGANWSLVVDAMSRSDDGMEWIANVRFLEKEAPSERVVDAAKFELYEGAKCVANGVILASTLEYADVQLATEPQNVAH